jgi:hypothetical protein
MATVDGTNLAPACSSIVVVLPATPAQDAVGVDDGWCDGVGDDECVGDGRCVGGRVVATGERGEAGVDEETAAAGEEEVEPRALVGWWR